MQKTTPNLENVSAPADATRVGDWTLFDTAGFARGFDGTARNSNGVHVKICGWQRADGTVIGRGIVVDLRDVGGELPDAASARAMARELEAAAAEMEALG